MVRPTAPEAAMGVGMLAAAAGLALILVGIYPSLVSTSPPDFDLVWPGVALFIGGFLAAIVGMIAA